MSETTDTPLSEWEAWAERFFPSIDAFYAADPRRERSGEVDFGVMWRDGTQPWPHYRVSWVEATGEFYAVRLAGQRGSCPVELLGSAASREDADAVLSGWAEHDVFDLAWVRGRLA